MSAAHRHDFTRLETNQAGAGQKLDELEVDPPDVVPPEEVPVCPEPLWLAGAELVGAVPPLLLEVPPDVKELPLAVPCAVEV